ncbi:MAG: NrfD/PsrC family molybdoenzyme membrane anchor subunit, partial [Streptosporangiaceae bacterium]
MSGPGSAWGVHGRGQHERDQHERDQNGQDGHAGPPRNGDGQHRPGQPGDGQHGSGRHGSGKRGGRGGEQLVVPRAQPDSYYGKPILKEPVWRSPEVPGYLFLGGLAGASSVLAGFAQAAGNRKLARASKIGAAGAIAVSGVALVADLGRPERFLNMLRVVKVTSPMSVGSWLITAFGGASAAAAASEVTGRLPRTGA